MNTEELLYFYLKDAPLFKGPIEPLYPTTSERPISDTMTEERYQYLNSLSIEEYDKKTSIKEQADFCAYQRKYHPDEVIYYQTHNPD